MVAIVDDNGKITHKYQYDDFGKVTQKDEADYNPFQYVGKYGVMYLTDHQYYMRARHYDPTIGRFLSEDPIWSMNLYPYADNNPIMGIDPEGKALIETTKILNGSEKIIEQSRQSLNNFLKDFKQSANNGIEKTKEELAKLKKDIQCNWDPSKPQCKGGNYPSQGLKDALKEDAKQFANGMIMGAVVVGAAVVVYLGGEIVYGVVVALEEGLATIATMSAQGQLIYLVIPVMA